ncbi:hypothetical protein Tco_0651874 [Tanacetum coccineum]|uniref:Uncharacterized protein n=1 Tax=Tanacetum coccineum TaxID=301880 RepID=A0ABQ4WW76_9ASTR
MDDPNITMEEYIWLEEEKARRHGRNFNWETATYGKVGYFDDFDYFKDFENEFPTIVDFDFEISFVEFDDEDYIVIYDNDSFSYKIFSTNDLKSDNDNDDDKTDIK